MSQIFHRSANALARATIFGAVFILGVLGYGAMLLNRSGYVTGAHVAIEQPVPFSHKHHANELGIDCRYCHTSVEVSHVAGIPPTKTCMNCHSQIWADSPTLEPVRASFRTDQSIPWIKVHDLPDFVYFDHSIHVAKGIGCASCHGRIDQMNLTWQENSLQMEWCLNCHRHPETFVRPKGEVFNMAYKVSSRTQETLGPRLVAEYDVHKEQLTNCSICHR